MFAGFRETIKSALGVAAQIASDDTDFEESGIVQLTPKVRHAYRVKSTYGEGEKTVAWSRSLDTGHGQCNFPAALEKYAHAST